MDEIEKSKNTLIKFLKYNNLIFDALDEATQATILDLYLQEIKMPIINYLKLEAPIEFKDMALYDIRQQNQILCRTDAIKKYTKKFIESIEYFVTVDSPYRNSDYIYLYFPTILEYFWTTGDWVKIENPIRKEAAKKAVITKTKKLFEYINSLKIKIPLMEEDILYKEAIRSYRNMMYSRNKFDIDEFEGDHRYRLMVNYLRHELTQYEQELYDMWGKVGKTEGIDLLRHRIYNAIMRQYPYLKNECIKQMQYRGCHNIKPIVQFLKGETNGGEL